MAPYSIQRSIIIKEIPTTVNAAQPGIGEEGMKKEREEHEGGFKGEKRAEPYIQKAQAEDPCGAEAFAADARR